MQLLGEHPDQEEIASYRVGRDQTQNIGVASILNVSNRLNRKPLEQTASAMLTVALWQVTVSHGRRAALRLFEVHTQGHGLEL